MLKVTDVRIRKILPEGKVKAIVSITLDDAIVIHDIKVLEGQNGLFMAMPGRKIADGQFRNIAHPISQQVRDILEDLVMAKYQQALADLEQAVSTV